MLNVNGSIADLLAVCNAISGAMQVLPIAFGQYYMIFKACLQGKKKRAPFRAKRQEKQFYFPKVLLPQQLVLPHA